MGDRTAFVHDLENIAFQGLAEITTELPCYDGSGCEAADSSIQKLKSFDVSKCKNVAELLATEPTAWNACLRELDEPPMVNYIRLRNLKTAYARTKHLQPSFFATLWRGALGVWTNREAEDQLKVSQPRCGANAALIYPEKIPDSLLASLPLSPQLRAAGTKYPSMESVKIVNDEQPMTQGELMKGLDAVTRRYARPISGKYTIEQLKAQVGKRQA